MTFGLAWMAITIGLLSRIDTGTSLWLVRLAMFSVGAGYGVVLVPLQASSFARIKRADTGRASALFNTTRQVASALGVAVLATALQAWVAATDEPGRHRVTPSDVAGYQRTFLLAAVIAALGAFVALRIRDSDAASTMRQGEASPESEQAAVPVPEF